MTALMLALMTIPLLYLAGDSYQLDFRAFYVASASLAEHLDPYADHRDQGDRFQDPVRESEFSRWVYPPSALFFVQPLATLPYLQAKRLFALLSLASLIAVLVFLADRFCVADPWTLLVYASLPVMACIEKGQVDPIILALLVISFAWGRRVWSGIPLGLAIAFKVFPAALLLWLCLRRRFLEASVAVVTTAAMALLAGWRFGFSSYSSFLNNILAPPAAHLSYDSVGLLHGISVDGRWLMLSRPFLGSFNNPLLLLGNTGILVGAALVVAITVYLAVRQVSDEVGFFTVVLISELVNTKLWLMGIVMYVPICMIALGAVRSSLVAGLLMIPLFLPSAIEYRYLSPRYVIALLLIGYLVWKGMGNGTRDDSTAIDVPQS